MGKTSSVFMMAKVYNVINSNTVKPTDNTCPTAPTEPADISTAADTGAVNCLNALWTQYNIRMNAYNHSLGEYNQKVSTWTVATPKPWEFLTKLSKSGSGIRLRQKLPRNHGTGSKLNMPNNPTSKSWSISAS